MRPLGLADVEMAARVLMRVAPAARQNLMQQMIRQAEVADQFRLDHGRPHALYGVGSLMACAARHPAAPRPDALGSDALHAYSVALRALICRATDQSQ